MFAASSQFLSYNDPWLSTKNDRMIRYILHDHTAGTDFQMPSDMDAANNLRSCTDEHMVTDHRRASPPSPMVTW